MKKVLKRPRRTRKRTSQKKKTGSKRARKGPVVRWNPNSDDVQRSVVKLVLTLVELIRKLMERQAIRRMDARTLTGAETEAVGRALMEIEQTIRDIGQRFDLTPEDLNLDLGALKIL
jgi:gas vesicle protein GvpK